MQVITSVPKVTIMKLKVNHLMLHQEIAEMDGEEDKNNFHMNVVSDIPMDAVMPESMYVVMEDIN